VTTTTTLHHMQWRARLEASSAKVPLVMAEQLAVGWDIIVKTHEDGLVDVTGIQVSVLFAAFPTPVQYRLALSNADDLILQGLAAPDPAFDRVTREWVHEAAAHAAVYILNETMQAGAASPAVVQVDGAAPLVNRHNRRHPIGES